MDEDIKEIGDVNGSGWIMRWVYQNLVGKIKSLLMKLSREGTLSAAYGNPSWKEGGWVR